MAYEGYLIKILKKDDTQNDYIIPMHWILEKSYDATWSVLDFNSTRNGKGNLIRNAVRIVPHCTVTFKQLYNDQVGDLWSSIRKNYVVGKEKKVKASIWLPERNEYREAYFYIPDTKMTIDKIINDNTKIRYESFTMEFIGY